MANDPEGDYSKLIIFVLGHAGIGVAMQTPIRHQAVHCSVKAGLEPAFTEQLPSYCPCAILAPSSGLPACALIQKSATQLSDAKPGFSTTLAPKGWGTLKSHVN